MILANCYYIQLLYTKGHTNRTTHKLFTYDVAVPKLSCLIVFTVICIDNFWKADMAILYYVK